MSIRLAGEGGKKPVPEPAEPEPPGETFWRHPGTAGGAGGLPPRRRDGKKLLAGSDA